ncbi:hypothetical protein JCM10212_006467 [Sporobolomyces blumeae]
MPRLDHPRAATALRPLSLSQGVLPRSDGSAQFSFGNVTVLSSVTGPVEVRIREELVDRATFEIHVRGLRSTAGPGLKAIEDALRTTLTPLILVALYPRSLIQLTCQTTSLPSTSYSRSFSTDPEHSNATEPRSRSAAARRGRSLVGGGQGSRAGENAARVNSAMAALIDSGIQLRGTIVAVAVAFVPSISHDAEADDDEDDDDDEEGDELVLDPTPFEEEVASSTHVFTIGYGTEYGGREGTVVGVESNGTFDAEQLFSAQRLALTAAQSIYGFLRKSIEAKYGVNSQGGGEQDHRETTTKGGNAGADDVGEDESEDGMEE